MNFKEWLYDSTDLAESSINRYYSAIKTISKEMINEGVINKPFEQMDILELEIAISFIFWDKDFCYKNNNSNRVYSSALKRFRYYRMSTCEDEYNITIKQIDKIKNDNSISKTQKKTLIDARLGQGTYRKSLINKYKHCIITGITNTKLLIASHIKPWSVSNNYERLSDNNGLLLSPTYDKLFDLGLITFDKKSRIKISGLLGKQDKEILNIDTKKEYDLKLNKEGILNMEYHNDVIFIN